MVKAECHNFNNLIQIMIEILRTLSYSLHKKMDQDSNQNMLKVFFFFFEVEDV